MWRQNNQRNSFETVTATQKVCENVDAQFADIEVI